MIYGEIFNSAVPAGTAEYKIGRCGMSVVYSSLIGYVLGCINPSYLIARFKGIDIRERGSKNAGASNAVIVLGKFIGIFAAVFDIMKAFFAYRLSEKLFPGCDYAGILSGCFCILGHIFPAVMGFRGGKGLAALGGVVLAYNVKLFFVLLLCEMLVLLITGYICFVPVTASFAFAVCYAFSERNVWMSVLLFALSAVILLKHTVNFKRIKNGTEMRISYLWKKDEEKDRINQSSDK